MMRKIIDYFVTRYKFPGNIRFISLMIYLYLSFYNKTLIKKNKKYFLSFEKSRFNLDINATKEFSSINVLNIPLKMSTTLGQNFLPKFLQSQKNYHMTNEDGHNRAKKEYYNFLLDLISQLSSKFNIGGLIVGNFDYWEHQEWSKASHEFDIPTFCLYRESYSWDAKIFWRKNLYKNFINQIPKMEICVFGNQAKQWLKDIPALSNSNFYVTGSPRTDYHYLNCKNKDKNNKSKDLIVLFDFYGQNYGDNIEICSHHNFKFVDLNTKFCLICNKSFSDISAEVTNKFISLSKLPDLKQYKFIIKTKEPYYSKVVNETFGEILNKSNNIIVTSSLDFENIILNSKIIVGSFRSTAIAESFISKASIVLPYWDNQKNKSLDNINDGLETNLYKLEKREAFENTFLEIIKNSVETNDESIHKRLELINEGLYKIDGLSSKRFEDVLNRS